MSLVPSLLQAIVRVDGDALVMHAGDKPYVVSPTGQVDLASRGLALDAVDGIVAQLLSPESLGALEEFGAVQYELPPSSEFPGEHFTVVAARGGDDLWVEVRRRRVPDDDRVPDEMFVTPGDASAATEVAVQSDDDQVPVEMLASAHGDQFVPLDAASTDAVLTDAPVARMPAVDHDLALPDATQLFPEETEVVEEEGAEAVPDVPLQPAAVAPAPFVPPPMAPPPIVAPSIAPPAIAASAPESFEPVVAVPRPAPFAPKPVISKTLAPKPVAPARIAPPPVAPLPVAPPPVVFAPVAPKSVAAPAVEPVAPKPVAPFVVEPMVPPDEPSVALPVEPLPEPIYVAPEPAPIPLTPAPEPMHVAPEPALIPVAPAPEPMPVAPEPAPMPVAPVPIPVAPARAPKPFVPAPAPVPFAPIPAPVPMPPVPAPLPVAPAAAVTPPRAPKPQPIAVPPLPIPEPAIVLPMSRNPIRTEQVAASTGDPTMDGLQRLLRISAARGASTLYLSTDAQPAVRVDGELHGLDSEPVLTARDIESLLLTLMPERSHEALRTGAPSEWMCDIEDVGRVRCTTFRDHVGPGGVFRLMPTRTVSADQLGLPRSVQLLAIEPEGLVLVVGPRSSGKRTLISAFVDLINRTRRDHVVTIEREINIVHPRGSSFISQREVRGSDEDLVVASRAALREDPDVLVIEDLRTGALMNVALEAAASGRLVIGGFSAHTATAAIDRIIDLYAPDQRRQVQLAIADTLRGVIAQVLLRKVGGGRVAAREVLLNTPAVSGVIAEGKTSQLPMAIEGGRRHGMLPLSDTLVGLVQNGIVDAREAYKHASDRGGLLAALKRHGVDTSELTSLVG